MNYEKIIQFFLIAIIFGFSIILNSIFERKDLKKVEKTLKDKAQKKENEKVKDLEKEIIKDDDLYLTPVQAAMILEDNLKNYHIIATILHFLELDIIDLTKIYRNDGTWAYRFEKKDKFFCDYNMFSGDNFSKENINKAKEKKISISEVYIIDRIVFKYYNYVNADRIYEFYDSIDDYSKLYNSRKIQELKELDYDLDKVKELIKEEFVRKGLKITSESSPNTFEYVDFNKKYEEILRYKNKLKYDTLLPERSIENVHLWGEHLIYGVAFNVCKTSIKDAIEIYKGKRKK